MAPFPPELRRYRLIVVGASLFLAGAGAIALIAALSPDTTRRSAIVLALFAIAALAVSGFGLLFVPRWYRRAAYVVSTAAPFPGVATLTLDSDSDSTSLYADVSTSEPSIRPLHRVALLIPRWDVRPFVGSSLEVGLHVDPGSSRLMAISSKPGVLWCMPTGQVMRHGGTT
jgi:hypothetical protein